MNDQQMGITVKLLALGLVGSIVYVIWRRSRRRGSRFQRPTDAPVAPLPIPESSRVASVPGSRTAAQADQIKFVRGRVIEHRDQYLTFLAHAHGIRLGLRLAQIESALAGRTPCLSDPVLLLQSDDFWWQSGQLSDVVDAVLQELGLPESGEANPTVRASEACRKWAELEAPRFMSDATRASRDAR